MDPTSRAWLHCQSSSPLFAVSFFRMMLLCLSKSILIRFLVANNREPLWDETLPSRGKGWRLLQLCFICLLKEWYCASHCPGRDSSTERRFLCSLSSFFNLFFFIFFFPSKSWGSVRGGSLQHVSEFWEI